MTFFLILPALILIALIVGVTYFVTKLQNWKALPTQQAYQARYGALCNHCQGEQRQEYGLWGKDSHERIYDCASCHTKLYRNELTDLD